MKNPGQFRLEINMVGLTGRDLETGNGLLGEAHGILLVSGW